MDVSIAVSLIRGQMGAVVERAVNGAVETVLAEMLKVVGVKFEELKSQVALMKKDITLLQREKAQKEKENDNIRAKLRYTELKLKYYRQGVEEELQQRASASTMVRIHPSVFLQTQGGCAGVSTEEASPSCSTQPRTSEGPLAECTSPLSKSRSSITAHDHPDIGVAGADTSDMQMPVSVSEDTAPEALDNSTVLFCPSDTAQSKEQEDDCEWTIAVQPHSEDVDAVQALYLDPEPQSAPDSLSPADSSSLPSSAPQQVKQEAVEQQDEEVICIKEEPDEVQEVMATLLLDCQTTRSHLPESEAQRSAAEWAGLPASHRNHTAAFSSADPNLYETPQSVQAMVALPSGMAPRPWTKDLSLYEEYKLRRNELRRRSLSRRRELEKTLPQPLLADLVRERREKTRLRVARWRAKRKLQACMNQDQTLGGTAGLSQTGFPISSQHQQLRVTCAAASSSQQRQSSALSQSSSFFSDTSAANRVSSTLPFLPAQSSVLLRGLGMAPHPHAAAAAAASSCPPVSLLHQSISLSDTDLLQ